MHETVTHAAAFATYTMWSDGKWRGAAFGLRSWPGRLSAHRALASAGRFLLSRLSRMADLNIEIEGDHIVVTIPGTSLSAIYVGSFRNGPDGRNRK